MSRAVSGMALDWRHRRLYCVTLGQGHMPKLVASRSEGPQASKFHVSSSCLEISIYCAPSDLKVMDMYPQYIQ